MNLKLVKRVLDVASAVLVFSGIMDLIEWFWLSALIPSWTISVMAFGSTVLIQVLKRTMK